MAPFRGLPHTTGSAGGSDWVCLTQRDQATGPPARAHLRAHRQRNWLCFARKATPRIGFVLPRSFACMINHNSFSSKYLPVVSPWRNWLCLAQPIGSWRPRLPEIGFVLHECSPREVTLSYACRASCSVSGFSLARVAMSSPSASNHQQSIMNISFLRRQESPITRLRPRPERPST